MADENQQPTVEATKPTTPPVAKREYKKKSTEVADCPSHVPQIIEGMSRFGVRGRNRAKENQLVFVCASCGGVTRHVIAS